MLGGVTWVWKSVCRWEAVTPINLVKQCLLECTMTTVLASAIPILQGRDSEIDTSRGGSLVLDVFADNVEGRSTTGCSEVRGRP